MGEEGEGAPAPNLRQSRHHLDMACAHPEQGLNLGLRTLTQPAPSPLPRSVLWLPSSPNMPPLSTPPGLGTGCILAHLESPILPARVSSLPSLLKPSLLQGPPPWSAQLNPYLPAAEGFFLFCVCLPASSVSSLRTESVLFIFGFQGSGVGPTS